jgi:hypothetical protein
LDEIEEIKQRVKNENEIDYIKSTKLTNKDKTVLFCEVKKTIYIADKVFYKEKLKAKKAAGK